MSTLLTLLAPLALAAGDASAPIPSADLLPPIDFDASGPVYGAPLPAAYLATVAQGEDVDEIDETWNGLVQFGGSFTDGNTDIYKLNATATATKELFEGDMVKHAFTLGGYWAFGQDKNQTNSILERRWGVRAQYDHFFEEKLYGYVTGSFDNDFLSGLDLRSQAGVGLGYQFEDKENYKVSGEAGLSYVDEDYTLNTADTEFLAARLAYDVWWQINERWAFQQLAEAFPSLQDSDDLFVRLNTSLSGALTETMTFGVNWLMLYDNTPIPSNQRVDHIVSATVGWAF